MTTTLDALSSAALAELLMSIADDEFIIGFWDSEWTGIAPMLEEDVATSSIAQDEIGHAKVLYELLAELTDGDADQIAFGRAPDAFRHASLMNHARGDWAFSVARRYLYETADQVRLAALAGSTYEPMALLAGKMRREETYHMMHADTWLRRLADGGAEGRDRLSSSLECLWADAHDVFAPLVGEEMLVKAGILPEPMVAMSTAWEARVRPKLEAICGALPAGSPAIDGRTRRTSDFAWLHGEFTSVVRSEEAATW